MICKQIEVKLSAVDPVFVIKKKFSIGERFLTMLTVCQFNWALRFAKPPRLEEQGAVLTHLLCPRQQLVSVLALGYAQAPKLVVRIDEHTCPQPGVVSPLPRGRYLISVIIFIYV